MYSEKRINLNIIRLSCVLGTIISVVFGILNIVHKNKVLTGSIDILFAVFLSVLFFLIQRKKHNLDLIIKVFIIVGIVFFSYLLFDGGYRNTAILWTLLLPVFCFLLKNERMGLLYYFTFMIVLTAFYICKNCFSFSMPYSNTLLVVLYVVLLFEGIFMYSYKSYRKEAQISVKTNMSAMLEKADELTIDNKILKQLSTYDALTKIYNRRGIMEVLNNEMQRKQRFGNSFSIIMADIDDFKKINDTYGHLFGDYILYKFSDILVNDILRKIDSIGRYGGEEFMIILPATQIEGAEIVAERINRIISSTLFTDERTGKSSHASVSLGISTSEQGTSIEEIIHTADRALYQAKANGKNCFVTFSEPFKQTI